MDVTELHESTYQSHSLYRQKRSLAAEDENFERWSSMGCFYQLMLKWHIKDFFPLRCVYFGIPCIFKWGKMFYVTDNGRVKVSLILCSTWHNGWSSNAWDNYHHHLASVIKNTLQEMGKKMPLESIWSLSQSTGRNTSSRSRECWDATDIPHAADMWQRKGCVGVL